MAEYIIWYIRRLLSTGPLNVIFLIVVGVFFYSYTYDIEFTVYMCGFLYMYTVNSYNRVGCMG